MNDHITLPENNHFPHITLFFYDHSNRKKCICNRIEVEKTFVTEQKRLFSQAGEGLDCTANEVPLSCTLIPDAVAVELVVELRQNSEHLLVGQLGAQGALVPLQRLAGVLRVVLLREVYDRIVDR